MHSTRHYQKFTFMNPATDIVSISCEELHWEACAPPQAYSSPVPTSRCWQCRVECLASDLLLTGMLSVLCWRPSQGLWPLLSSIFCILDKSSVCLQAWPKLPETSATQSEDHTLMTPLTVSFQVTQLTPFEKTSPTSKLGYHWLALLILTMYDFNSASPS